MQRPADRSQIARTSFTESRHIRPHLSDERRHGFAAVAREFAADQIIRLDAVRSLIDRCNSRVAQVLRGTRFLDIPHAAMHLNAGRGDGDPEIGAPRLDHWDQQICATLCCSARRWLGVPAALIDHPGGVIG